jgi:hypothetical protein
MSVAVSLAGGSAVEASLHALHRSGAQLQGSAEAVVGASVGALNGTGTDIRDTVTISDAAASASGQSTLEGGLLDGQVAGLVYTANARVVQGAHDVTGTVMSLVA